MHIEFDIKNSGITYVSGDHSAVVPQNDPEVVVALSKRLGIHEKLDVAFNMTAIDSSSSKKHPFPCPTTYRTALSKYLDIMNPPKGHILSAMAEYAESQDERGALLGLLGSENKACIIIILSSFISVHLIIELIESLH